MMKPTDEQQQAVDLAKTGGSLAITAGAGTGKTSTLTMIGEALPHKRAQYIAFNSAIVKDAQGRFSDNVSCSTAHSLAYQAVGRVYRDRLQNAAKLRSWEVADLLGCDPIKVDDRKLTKGLVATLVTRGVRNFCMSADALPAKHHVPHVEGIGQSGNDRVRKHVAKYLLPAWIDLTKTDGRLPFSHDVYLKIWALTEPKINADIVLFDEAQDASAVMMGIVEAQTHAQRIWCGDAFQQLYEWRGSLDAMTLAKVEHRSQLTQSWRFGQPIADEANRVLRMLGAPFQLSGNPARESRVGFVDQPDVLLCRTNARAVVGALDLLERGGKPAIVGGAADVIAFARAAMNLMDGKRTEHPLLMGFETWYECKEYAKSEESDDDDLTRMIGLVDRFGPSTIVGKLSQCTKEHEADRVFSTAHRSKGREWDHVRLADDFPEIEKMETESLRLLYVASTRAKLVLDAPVLDPSYRKLAA